MTGNPAAVSAVVLAGGTQTNVTYAGQGDPALMIHCSLARHQSLLPLAAKLPIRATLFDLPGHGQSGDWNPDIPYQDQAVAMARDLITPDAHIIGHSFGATVALRLALESPDLVSRLTLIEPVMFGTVQGSDLYQQMITNYLPFNAAHERGDTETMARLFMGWWGDGTPWDDLPEHQKQGLIRRIPLIVAARGATDLDQGNLLIPNRLEGLAIPVDLIAGAQTEPIIHSVHKVLARRLPHVDAHVVDGASHMVALTHVPEVAAIIQGRSEQIAAQKR